MCQCIQCLETKSLSDFYIRSDSGRPRTKCKSCWDAKNKRWAAANVERRKVIALRYARANKDKNRQWKRDNPDRAKQWDKEHPVEVRRMKAKWDKENPHKKLADVNKRRFKKVNALPRWADVRAMEEIYKTAQRSGLEVDHIIPMVHPLVCGLHVPANLAIVDTHTNRTKSNKFTPEVQSF